MFIIYKMYTEQSFNSARADLIKCELLARTLFASVDAFVFIFFSFFYQCLLCVPMRSIFNKFYTYFMYNTTITCAANRNANGRGCSEMQNWTMLPAGLLNREDRHKFMKKLSEREREVLFALLFCNCQIYSFVNVTRQKPGFEADRLLFALYNFFAERKKGTFAKRVYVI